MMLQGPQHVTHSEETPGQTHHIEHPVLNTLQMHITYAGTSSMLFNEEPMRGTPRMVQKLAEREAAVSEAVSLLTALFPCQIPGFR